MDKNPLVDQIFSLCADVDPRQRIGIAISIAATEAMRISKFHPELKAYMDAECGPDWQTRTNGGIVASLAFIRFVHEDRFNKPRVTVEA